MVGCLYRLLDANTDSYDCMLHEFERFRSLGEQIVVLGDLTYDNKFDESLFKYIEDLYNMSQILTKPTRVTTTTSNLLDIILSMCSHSMFLPM
jgi:copper homeostasis protein CutC